MALIVGRMNGAQEIFTFDFQRQRCSQRAVEEGTGTVDGRRAASGSRGTGTKGQMTVERTANGNADQTMELIEAAGIVGGFGGELQRSGEGRMATFLGDGLDLSGWVGEKRC